MNRRHTLFLIICALIIIQGQMVSAEIWIENFNGNNLDSWKEYDNHFGKGIWAPKTVWRTKGGKLDVWIDPPPSPAPNEFPLEFIGFPIKVKELNVKVKILHKTRNDNIGIIMGQYTAKGGVMGHTFKFLDRPFIDGQIQTPHNFEIVQIDNEFDEPKLPLDELEISFNNGHFKFLSKGDLINELKVPELTTIDCIGIIAYVERGLGHIGTFVLDDFVISGSTVPAHGTLDVRAKDKTTVLWGELKQK